MGHWNGKFDVAHALTTDTGESHLHTATVADRSLVLDALVFAAGTLPVLSRTEDALTEQTTLFRLESPVVDGLRVLDLSTTPGADRFGVGDRDANVVKTVGLSFKAENFVQMGF